MNLHQPNNSPSQIDEAINELILKVSDFSDEFFDTEKMHLDGEQLEALVALLIQEWTKNLDGKSLAGYLNVLRHG
ncbi:MAG: hypothetical protein F6K58_08690 [Symploca sp. SIO2E9]|nr:hypothetical protein [Symploca sp. SIO2E9]